MPAPNTGFATIARVDDGVRIIDQTLLPHEFRTVVLKSAEDCAHAIQAMLVRGAPLIGATAAFGIALAMRTDNSSENLDAVSAMMVQTRPTAVNLRWAVDGAIALLRPLQRHEREMTAFAYADRLCDEDRAICESIGRHGLELLRESYQAKQDVVNVLTHCNAGRLATMGLGTALAPIYLAHEADIPIHVWVDETRPRNQGASLTAWELAQYGVSHTVIVDNAGGHLMQSGAVDRVITGTDRVTAKGDVCNKIGTYLKALAAYDNGVPFHVALPSPTIDWGTDDIAEVPIEERSGDEVSTVQGVARDGTRSQVTITPRESALGNPAFDMTPARLVTSLITERGCCPASFEGLQALFPAQSGTA